MRLIVVTLGIWLFRTDIPLPGGLEIFLGAYAIMFDVKEAMRK